MRLHVWPFALSALTLVAAFLTGAGLMLAAALKTEPLADKILAYYPLHKSAMRAVSILEKLEYPVVSDPQGHTTNVGVLSIDDPDWEIILEFVKSEIAVRKSERNEPSPIQPTPNRSAEQTSGDPGNTPPRATAPLPPINFDRIKSIVSLRQDVISAGPKPLAPPYQLLVLSPSSTPRRVYEYLSFREFRLDLRRMLLGELEEWSLWIAFIAFAVGTPIVALRRIMNAAETRRLLRSASTSAARELGPDESATAVAAT